MLCGDAGFTNSARSHAPQDASYWPVRRPQHNTDYPPTRWSQSPRIVVQCAPQASNGPTHLGLHAPSQLTKSKVVTIWLAIDGADEDNSCLHIVRCLCPAG